MRHCIPLNSGTKRALWLKLRRLGPLNLSVLRSSLLLKVKPLTLVVSTAVARKIHIKMLFSHYCLVVQFKCLQGIPKKTYFSTFTECIARLEKCVSFKGEYFKGLK